MRNANVTACETFYNGPVPSIIVHQLWNTIQSFIKSMLFNFDSPSPGEFRSKFNFSYRWFLERNLILFLDNANKISPELLTSNIALNAITIEWKIFNTSEKQIREWIFWEREIIYPRK